MKEKYKYKNKKILVLGLARSGVAACKLLLEKGAKITGYDSEDVENLGTISSEIQQNIELKCGVSADAVDPSGYDKIITSPGIPPHNPIIKKAMEQGVPVISELELGLENLPLVYIIAVTGTNGKTTTCELLNYIAGGIIAGNIGTPLSAEVKNIKKGDLIILEVSSYQIPFSPSLIPDIGIMLNIFPEHISWHGNYDNYLFSKKEMFLRQTSSNISIFNKNIEDIEEFLDGIESKKVFFSSNEEVSKGVCMKENNIVYINENEEEDIILQRDQFSIDGIHNLENFMAAVAAWRSMGGKKLPDMNGFSLPPHRMEEFGVLDGVVFINDSKATNMDSTLRALESMDKPVILLMGGRSKKQKHPNFRKAVRERVEKIVAFGESKEDIKKYLSDIVPVETAPGLEEATVIAWNISSPGDVVLMSPGGSSFDEFNDYCERGDKFKKWVKELPQD